MEHIDYEQVWQRLDMAAAIDALEVALRETGVPDTPPRQHVHAGEQELLLMPAFADGGAGVKLITIDPSNPQRGLPRIQGVFILFSAPGLEPTALIDARALTELRTAAVSGVATRYLARPDARRLVVFGSGAQARSHLLAMATVLDLDDVRIVARNAEAAAGLLAYARDGLGLHAELAEPSAVADADVICTCTTATTPLFDGALLPRGVHVNAVGSYRPDMQEIDAATVTRSRVVVETREAALREAGDLIAPHLAGAWHPDDVRADLSELVREGLPVREHADDLTLFESVGMAFEDLVVARAILGATPS